jgi:hypothetical protein
MCLCVFYRRVGKMYKNVYCAMQKYYIITVEVRKILLNETNESTSPLFHHYKRLLRTRTRAVSNHLTPLVQDSARSSAFDRSLLLLRFVALHCDGWFRAFVGLLVFVLDFGACRCRCRDGLWGLTFTRKHSFPGAFCVLEACTALYAYSRLFGRIGWICMYVWGLCVG